MFISAGYCQQLDYPEARRSNHVDIYHGREVPDPYRWMENMDSKETRKWVKGQKGLLENFLSGSSLRPRIKNRISDFQSIASFGLPVKAGGNYFYTKTPPHKKQPVLLMQDTLNGNIRELINPYQDFDSETDRLVSFSASPNGRYVVYQVADNVSRWRRLYIIDTKFDNRLHDVLVGLHTTQSGISWGAGGKGFYYTRFPLPEGGETLQSEVKNPSVYYHKVGSLQAKDRLIYADSTNSNLLFRHKVTHDDKYLIISSRRGADINNKVLYKDLQKDGPVKELIAVADAAYTFLGNKGNRLWFYTTRNAPNGKIISLDLRYPKKKSWLEVIPEKEEASIAGGSLAGGNALGMYDDKLVIMYLKGVRRSVKVFNLEGKHEYNVKLPNTGSIWGGFSGNQNDNEIFYRFLSLNYPRLVYKLNLDTGKSELFKNPESDINLEDYTTKIVEYRSKDGTKVPMFVTHKRGVKRDGTHPVFMYGYGAFGWVSFPWYQPRILTWLEMGGIYAIPAIRGGGEFGEEWHRSGIKTNRQNAIDDYIAAAEWFIDRGYTTSQKLVANGGSASGMVAAAAIIQRPNLFGAALIDIPALDMLRYHKFTAAGAWIQEFGSVEIEKEFKALYNYSPYHNIQENQCYPSTLVTVGEEDETAVPMHGYKFVGSLQWKQNCSNPVLLKVVENAGHRYGSSPCQRAQTWADQLTFLTKVLDLEVDFFEGENASNK